MESRPLRALFICEKGVHFSAVAREMMRSGWECSAITLSRSHLTRVKGWSEILLIDKSSPFIPTVLSQHKDFLLSFDFISFGTDKYLGEVAASSLSQLEKKILLPISTDMGLAVMDSKIGFTSLVKKLQLPTPRSSTFSTRAELLEECSSFTPPFVIKGDRGGGGSAVKVIRSLEELDPLDELQPGVIQEFLNLKPVGVEVIFNQGRVASWAYCADQLFTANFGPSMRRHYSKPPSLDFLEHLEKFGEATGAQGFANASFFYLPEANSHQIFECDLRANHWVRLYPYLGVDVATLLSHEWNGEVFTPPFAEEGETFIHYGRALTAAGDAHDAQAFLSAMRMYRRSSDFLAGEGHFFIYTALNATKFLPRWLKKFLKSLRRYI